MSGKNDRRRRDRRDSGRRRDEPAGRPKRRRRAVAGILLGLAAGAVLLSVSRRPRPSPLPSVDPDTLWSGEIYTVRPDSADAARADSAARDSLRRALEGAEFEELLSAGAAARGLLVAAELLCGPVLRVRLLEDEAPYPALVALADTAGRVAAAECEWVDPGADRGPDFLLVIPPERIEAVEAIPEVPVRFVRRRRLPARLEWIGASRALALRPSGILRVLQMGGV